MGIIERQRLILFLCVITFIIVIIIGASFSKGLKRIKKELNDIKKELEDIKASKE